MYIVLASSKIYIYELKLTNVETEWQHCSIRSYHMRCGNRALCKRVDGGICTDVSLLFLGYCTDGEELRG
jgi:hypothetical protein